MDKFNFCKNKVYTTSMYGRGVFVILSLLLPYNVFAIGLREPLKDNNVFIGGTVILSGTVTDNFENLPISWRRQDTQEVITLGKFVFSTKLYIRRRYSIDVFAETYNLRIIDVEIDDEGTFEIGYISNNQFVALGPNVLNVLIAPDAGFPVCKTSPVATEHLVGQTLTLTCETRGGKPKPDIVWKRNSVEVARISSNNTIDHTVILDTFDNDALFECELDGVAVSETLSCQERPSVATPTVNLESSPAVVDEGNDAAFYCVGQGVLSPAYDWSFPTHVLENGNYKLEHSNSKLTILKTTIKDNNSVVRCEMRSSGIVVAGDSVTLLIKPKPTTEQPTFPPPLNKITTRVSLEPTAIVTTELVNLSGTSEQQSTKATPVNLATGYPTTTQIKLTTTINKNTTTKQQKTTLAAAITKTHTRPVLKTEATKNNVFTVPNEINITTLSYQSEGTLETTPKTPDGAVPKQKDDDRKKHTQHLGLIFASATAVIIILTIVVFSAFCLVVCKRRDRKDTLNVSNNASSLAGSTASPYNNGIFRSYSEYHDNDDYELTDTISQRESQTSATESATAPSFSTSPDGLYTLPAKLGKGTKIYHPASSSQPDFSTFRLIDESLRTNKALSSNSIGAKRPHMVPAPKPPRSNGEYENVNRNELNSTIGSVPASNIDLEGFNASESTPLKIGNSKDHIAETQVIYENGRGVCETVLLEPYDVNKKKSPIVSPRSTTGNDYTYEDVLKIADNFLHDLEQLS